MATRTTITTISDLSGGEASETITFGIDGRMYELDVTAEEAIELRSAMRDYANAARPMGKGVTPTRPKPATRHQGRQDAQKVREWARSQGMPVSDRGRVAAAIQEQYDNRDRAFAPPAPTADPFTPPEPVTKQVSMSQMRAYLKAKGINTVGKRRESVTAMYAAHHEGINIEVIDIAPKGKTA